MATIVTRETKKGTHYRAQVRLKGHRPVSATFRRRTDARKWIQDTESAIRERRYFKQSEALRRTLAELIDRYIEGAFVSKPDSMARQTAQLERWKKELGHLLLADITPGEIAACRDKLLRELIRGKKPRSQSTVNRYLAALSNVFTKAVKEYEWLDENPVLRVSKFEEPKGRNKFLKEDEISRLLVACENSSESYLAPIVLIALSTGMRLGEITGLRWPDIDLKEGRLTAWETKNGDSRSLPLVNRALAAMEKHSRVKRLGTDLVFPVRRRGDWKPWDIRTAWNKAVKQAGLTDFRFHDLRHTAASYLAMNNASQIEIAAVLGHKTLQMVKRYSHLSDSHTRHVLTAMNERIFGAESVA